MDLQNPDSSSLLKNSDEFSGHAAAIGDSSGEKPSDSLDPRWPYLNRWTATTISSSPPSIATRPAVQRLLPPPSHLSLASPVASLVNPLQSTGLAVVCCAEKLLNEGNQSTILTEQAPATLGKEVAGEELLNHCPIQSPALKGAWAKKLNFSIASSSHQAPPISREMWHTLSVSKPSRKQQAREQQVFSNPKPKPAAVEDPIRFPWTAKMNPTTRNLYRATEPEYLEDGTLKRALWHVDDCLMFVASWTPEASLAIPEIKTIPVWVTLKNIPNILYSTPGISHIASGLGAPMATHKPRLDPILMGEAKILVEVELSKAFPSRIAADDLNGVISMVDVEYAWLPSKCSRCGQLGHKVKCCLQEENGPRVVDNTTKETVLMVDMDVAGASNSVPISAQNHSNSAPAISIEIPATNNFTVDLVKASIIEDIILVSTASTIVNATVLTAYQTSPSATNNNVIESSFLEFASLISPEEEKDLSDSDKEMDSMDLMTPSGKRILRERPVKPSAKAKEMNWQSTGRGRGNRGRGNRGSRS
ncbi:hypothetical protein EUTSA_v10006382mg [Eutrema salsugineum]|uniref:Uncharacterized protein n=1 Tax=Eutrema salsugineum TaxID=72664 RepID=V4LKP7_EUTSA|nr:hypothetical protein EUTSA_v10006382mg [Eutrema salsugineum]